MDPMTSHLDQTFGSFPEPVLLLDGDQVIYANEPGQALLRRKPSQPSCWLPWRSTPAAPWKPPWERLLSGHRLSL